MNHTKHDLPVLSQEFAWLTLPKGRKARVTKDGRISLYDALEASGVKSPRRVWSDLKARYHSVVRKTDDHLVGSIHLQLMATTEDLEVHHMAKKNANGNDEIFDAVNEVCVDIEGIRQKYQIPNLLEEEAS